MQELNSCPFCNSVQLELKDKLTPGSLRYAVRCKDCGLHGPVSGEKPLAKIYWNLLPSIAEADWLAARVKCDNAFTPEQEAACVKANGPCAHACGRRQDGRWRGNAKPTKLCLSVKTKK